MNFKPVTLQPRDWQEVTKLIKDALTCGLRTGTSRESIERILLEIETQSANPSQELCDLAFKGGGE